MLEYFTPITDTEDLTTSFYELLKLIVARKADIYSFLVCREMQLLKRSRPEGSSAIRTYLCAFNIKINPRKNKRDVPAFGTVFSDRLFTGFNIFGTCGGIIYCNIINFANNYKVIANIFFIDIYM